MDHGRIVVPKMFPDQYIAVEYYGRFLLLSMSDFNRFDEIGTQDIEIERETGMYITDIPVKQIVENYIRVNDLEPEPIQEYKFGMFVQHIYTKDIYGLVLARERQSGPLRLFRLLLDTFELQGLCTFADIDIIKKYYHTFDFRYKDLRIRINGGD